MLVSHELAQYVAAAYQEIVFRGNPNSIGTTSRCPECGADFDNRVDAMTDQDGAHLVLELSGDVFAVLVACEGYYVINPALLGLGDNHPNWSDGNGEIPTGGAHRA